MSACIVIGSNKAQVASTLEEAGYKALVFHLEERIDARRWLFIVTLSKEPGDFQKLAADVVIGGQPANLQTVSRSERNAALRALDDQVC